MQTSAPLLASQNLCDYCHTKPKYGQFNYCSKTCAAQVPSSKGGGNGFGGIGSTSNTLGLNFNLNPNPNPNNVNPTTTTKPRTGPANNNNNHLCDYCKKAPKHPGHDFCGKSCAQNAKSGGGGGGSGTGNQASSKSGTGGQTSTGSASTNSNSNPIPKSNPNNVKTPALNALVTQAAQAAVAALAGNANVLPALNAGANKSIDPTQIANLVVQQLQTFLPAVVPAPFSTPGAGAAMNPNSKSGLRKSAPGPNLRVQTQPLEPDSEEQEPGECLIPGCGQPVYVDESGQKQSAYCSMRHRQEAVDSGLASPCIFCLQLPQSETDYFCSRECREESLTKEKFHDTLESE